MTAPACAILIAILVAALGRAAIADPAPAPAPANLGAEQACDMIRGDLRKLAHAEHEQAFALDLSAGEGGSTPMVATQLAKLLERSAALRDTLRTVRERTDPGDPRVEECIGMGFRALAQAERLTTTVEEVLYGNDADARIRSDASQKALPARP
jgi:hypothetical protein